MYALPYFLVYRLHRLALDARRRDRTWRFVAWSVVSGLLASLLLGSLLVVAVALVAGGWWWLAAALVAIFVVPLANPQLVRHVLVPLGWYRAAYWIGHFTSMVDSDAAGMVGAAWAHARKPTPSGEAWIAARRDKRRPLGDTEVVVTALLAAGRGDADTARALMQSTRELVEVHPAVRELAGEWLACDAAERGAWAELAADAAAATWPPTTLTYFLEGLALARTNAPGAPGALELRVRWLLAPHRGFTRAFLVAPVAPPATGKPNEPTEATETAPAAPERAPLPRAMAAQLQLAARATAPDLASAVQAWDLALGDDATRAWIARRALELEAPLGAVDRAIKDVARAVTDELARIADASALGAPAARGVVGDQLARRLRHGRLDALEAGFNRWVDRRHSGDVRAPIDEWREWVALRAAYDAAVKAGGLDLRRLAFPHAYKTGNSVGTWLWNQRDEYALGHAIFAWLLGEAIAVGDTEAIDLCTRNARLAVPTRTGRYKRS